MNLENLNLVELNAQEVSNIDGGTPWWAAEFGVVGGAILAGIAIYDAVTDMHSGFVSAYHN